MNVGDLAVIVVENKRKLCFPDLPCVKSLCFFFYYVKIFQLSNDFLSHRNLKSSHYGNTL